MQTNIAVTVAEPTPLPAPIAWIIERPGRLPVLCHYSGCVETARANGSIVTPYYSKVVR